MSAIASEASIRIAYDGDALQAGTMDVRDLAPALLALSDLFDGANKVLNGPDRAIHLRVRHDVKRGSFDVGIQIVQTWASKIVSLFSGDAASGAANLIEILMFAAGGGMTLIKLVKWLRGRPIKRVETIGEDGVRLVVEGEEIIISRSLASVFNDVGIRRALAAVLAPLYREGIDLFDVKTASGKVAERVVKAELNAFTPPTPVEMAPQPIVTNEFQQSYTIIAVTFKDGNKWRVSDGQSTIGVTIEDAEFLQKVNRHDISFSKDDVIRCEVRQEQSMTGEGLKTEVFVKRILEHQHTYRQVLLPIFEAPPVQGIVPNIEKTKAPSEVMMFAPSQSGKSGGSNLPTATASGGKSPKKPGQKKRDTKGKR